jgi:hypothetical protein
MEAKVLLGAQHGRPSSLKAPPVAVVEILVLYRVLVRRLQAVAWVQSARFNGYNWVPVPIVINTGALIVAAAGMFWAITKQAFCPLV